MLYQYKKYVKIIKIGTLTDFLNLYGYICFYRKYIQNMLLHIIRTLVVSTGNTTLSNTHIK